MYLYLYLHLYLYLYLHLYLYLYLYLYLHLYLYLYYLKVNAFLSAYSLLLHHFQEQPLDQATTGWNLRTTSPRIAVICSGLKRL